MVFMILSSFLTSHMEGDEIKLVFLYVVPIGQFNILLKLVLLLMHIELQLDIFFSFPSLCVP